MNDYRARPADTKTHAPLHGDVKVYRLSIEEREAIAKRAKEKYKNDKTKKPINIRWRKYND